MKVTSQSHQRGRTKANGPLLIRFGSDRFTVSNAAVIGCFPRARAHACMHAGTFAQTSWDVREVVVLDSFSEASSAMQFPSSPQTTYEIMRKARHIREACGHGILLEGHRRFQGVSKAGVVADGELFSQTTSLLHDTAWFLALEPTRALNDDDDRGVSTVLMTMVQNAKPRNLRRSLWPVVACLSNWQHGLPS
jgi:hypothetical protein